MRAYMSMLIAAHCIICVIDAVISAVDIDSCSGDIGLADWQRAVCVVQEGREDRYVPAHGGKGVRSGNRVGGDDGCVWL